MFALTPATRIFVAVAPVDVRHGVNEPARWVLRDKPGGRHGEGANLAFADAHVERHAWRDERTLQAPRDDAVMPGNPDILWMQEHATWRLGTGEER